MVMELYFSDFFEVSDAVLEEYNAFNISLITDLPLFVDPFLLFNSEKTEYQQLHDQIINYLRFLQAKSQTGNTTPALLRAWYCFSEVRQNWLGFCTTGNTGCGLGMDFARALNRNLVQVFRNFGQERITQGSHIEKLTLIDSGVGRDMISDFTTNLIKDYILQYTANFAREHIDPAKKRIFAVQRAVFSYRTETWMTKRYELPLYQNDFVILTPKDILTKDETWINHSDMVRRFHEIPDAIGNAQLRDQINNYFYSMIPKEKPTKEDYARAIYETLRRFPELIDYYIRHKEDGGGQAAVSSAIKVRESDNLYIKQFGQFAYLLNSYTRFYQIAGTTKDETKQRIDFIKDVIENKGGHRFFYQDGEPIRREVDLHILFRLTWYGTPSDVSREVNDGRGPADYKISRGAFDKTLVEFKLASNTQLKRNLERQLEVYEKASDAEAGYKVIIFFSEEEFARVKKILKELKMEGDPNIILIDARKDNKPSGSRA